jgi:hypothetical protein
MARARHKIDRAKARRAPLPTALITCEGRVTEPAYLDALLRHLGLPVANVQIAPGDNHSDALAVVQRTLDRFTLQPDFDHVFAVVDGEQANLPDARELARANGLLRPDGRRLIVDLIVSHPCFEYWLLLHYGPATQPLPDAAAAEWALIQCDPRYRKNDRTALASLATRAGIALSHAAAAAAALQAAAASHPATDMPRLVLTLQTMAAQCQRP